MPNPGKPALEKAGALKMRTTGVIAVARGTGAVSGVEEAAQAEGAYRQAEQSDLETMWAYDGLGSDLLRLP
jgi:hypothetical protein